jgi:hypothetical protein
MDFRVVVLAPILRLTRKASSPIRIKYSVLSLPWIESIKIKKTGPGPKLTMTIMPMRRITKAMVNTRMVLGVILCKSVSITAG